MEGNSYDEEEETAHSIFFHNATKFLGYDVAPKWPYMNEEEKTAIKNKVRSGMLMELEKICGPSDLEELQMSKEPEMDLKRQTLKSLQGLDDIPRDTTSMTIMSSQDQSSFVEQFPVFNDEQISPAEAVVRRASENVRPLFQESNITMEEIESILKNDPPATTAESSKPATAFGIVNGADIAATRNDGLAAKKLLQNQLCGECDKFFSNKCALRRHQESVHWHTKSSRCNYCATDQWFTPYQRDQHVKRVHGKVTDRQRKRKSQGEICTGSVSEISNSSNRDCKYYECPIAGCERKFVTVKRLKIHLKNSRKHNRKDIQCLLCAESFSSNKARDIHVRQFHDIHVDIFLCSFCGQEFCTMRELDDHPCNGKVVDQVLAKIRLMNVVVKLENINRIESALISTKVEWPKTQSQRNLSHKKATYSHTKAIFFPKENPESRDEHRWELSRWTHTDCLIDIGAQNAIRDFSASNNTLDTESKKILCEKCGRFAMRRHLCSNMEGDLRDLGRSTKIAVNLCEICGELFEASSGHGCQLDIKKNPASPDSIGLGVFDLLKHQTLCEKCGVLVSTVFFGLHKCRIHGDTSEEDGKNAEKPSVNEKKQKI